MRNQASFIVELLRKAESIERRRLASHAFALAAVGAAALARWMLGFPATDPRLWLFTTAIAVSAARGGAAPALTATVASMLVASVSGVALTSGLLFAAEGLLIAGVVLVLRRSVSAERHRMTAIEPWMRDLKSTEREGRRLDAAFNYLDEAGETRVVLLDREGRVSSWRAGPTRLYGLDGRDVLGSSPAALFQDMTDEAFAWLIAEARQGETTYTGRQRRSDGTTFDAHVRIRPLSRGGLDGFAMIVRDLTSQLAHEQLQEEADLANRQLQSLRHITDPSLNSLAGGEFAAALLERLRTTIDAEGVALVYMDKFRRRVVCADGGVHCERGVYRPPIDLQRFHAGRTLMIHNDPAAVAEASAAGWPDDVGSMMAVPVIRGGAAQAVMEVVSRSGRRATEWEIALVQVAAARIAGFLQEDRYADSGAVA